MFVLNLFHRCADRQSLHKKCHEEVWHILKKNESRLSECAAQEVTSYANCADQQDRAKVCEVLCVGGSSQSLFLLGSFSLPLFSCLRFGGIVQVTVKHLFFKSMFFKLNLDSLDIKGILRWRGGKR